MKKTTADKIRYEIDYCVNTYTPWAWRNETLKWYLHGIVIGAYWHSHDMLWDEKEDILNEYLPMAMEWFEMRHEIERQQHKTA